MAYVIAAPCIADYACVEVCPVECIGPRPEQEAFDSAEQLYIDPDRCTDCGACLQVCPVQAIYRAAELPHAWRHYAAVNRGYFHREEA